LAAWLRQAICQTDLGARGGRRLAQSAKKEADAVLSRLHRKLLSAARKMRRGSDADRHRVRIAAKRLRYAAEFFQSMYRRKRCERYIERLAALQECLGWCNDAVVADGLLGRLARKGMATAGDARAARCLLSRATPAGRKELRKRWKEFRSSRPP
jgi:CHAD domain-containing protein